MKRIGLTRIAQSSGGRIECTINYVSGDNFSNLIPNNVITIDDILCTVKRIINNEKIEVKYDPTIGLPETFNENVNWEYESYSGVVTVTQGVVWECFFPETTFKLYLGTVETNVELKNKAEFGKIHGYRLRLDLEITRVHTEFYNRTMPAGFNIFEQFTTLAKILNRLAFMNMPNRQVKIEPDHGNSDFYIIGILDSEDITPEKSGIVHNIGQKLNLSFCDTGHIDGDIYMPEPIAAPDIGFYLPQYISYGADIFKTRKALSLVNRNENAVYIFWLKVPGATGYKIYRNDILLDEVDATITNYKDETTVLGTEYNYHITVLYQSGSEIVEGEISEKTPDIFTYYLSAPQEFKIESENKINILIWEDPVYHVNLILTGIRIYRNNICIDIVDEEKEIYHDKSIQLGETHIYYLKAEYKDRGESDPTEEKTSTIETSFVKFIISPGV